MKFKAGREQLNAALQKVNSVIGSRSTIMILGYVLVEAADGKVKLSATDLDIRIETSIPADVEEPGTTTVPAKKFQQFVKALPGAEAIVTGDEAHRVTVQSGDTCYSDIMGLSPVDFPVDAGVEAVRSLSIDQRALSKMLNLITYAVSTDDTRKALTGVLFSIGESAVTAVATDGRRLAVVERVGETVAGAGDAIVPVRAAEEVKRLSVGDGAATVEFGAGVAKFTVGETVLTTKLIEENYPNFRQVIPASFSRRLEIPREKLVASLQRMSLAVSERTYFVRIEFGKGRVELTGSGEVAKGKDSFDLVCDGGELSLSFNPTYLIEPLERLDCDFVSLRVNDGFNPVAFANEEGFLYVIMPLRDKA